MNGYRLSGKVAADHTITVQVPKVASIGMEAEVIVLLSETPSSPQEVHPLHRFLQDLRSRPVDADGPHRAEEAQNLLREMRAEWDAS